MDAKRFRNICLNAVSLVTVDWGTEIFVDGVRYSVVEKGADKLTKKQMDYLKDCADFNMGQHNTLKDNYNKYFGVLK